MRLHHSCFSVQQRAIALDPFRGIQQLIPVVQNLSVLDLIPAALILSSIACTGLPSDEAGVGTYTELTSFGPNDQKALNLGWHFSRGTIAANRRLQE